MEILVTVALTLLMGMEREEKSAADHSYIVAGVRTFPIIGLLGYAAALLSPDSAMPIALCFVAVAAFLVASYMHKLRDGDHGATTEMAVLAAYMVGALVARQLLWVATAIAVGSLLLLQARAPLKQFAVKLPPREVAAFARFLILAAVILPVLPNQEFTRFHLNPFKTWLIVVAVSGISYASYIVQRLVRSHRTVLLTALLGGAYSSTVTTVVLAKRSKSDPNPRLYAGAMLLASSVMYVRLAILLWIFNAGLGWLLGPRLLVVAAVGAGVACLIGLTHRGESADPQPADDEARNPLELTTALVFAALFLGISVVTQLAAEHLGPSGVYAVAAVMGTVDVDPFILGLTQATGTTTPLLVAAIAVVIAAASNNVMKGVYSLLFGDRRTGIVSLVTLTSLAIISLCVLIRL